MANKNNTSQLRQKLAAIEHERWADWQSWVHECIENDTIDEYIPRWKRQILTSYQELSDREKASDMEQVDRYWPLIEAYIQSQLQEQARELLKHKIYGHLAVPDCTYFIPVKAVEDLLG